MRRLKSAAPIARTLALAAALTCVAAAPQTPIRDLVAVREIADGVTLFHLTDPALVDPPAPISVWMLRLDPARATLEAALANDEVVGTETVAETAARHRAVAAINAGFFLPNGDPAGLFKLDGRLVSDTRRPRGAVGITTSGKRTKIVFDRVTATMALTIHGRRGRETTLPVDGIDTTRLRGKLMLFTSAYHDDTDTAPGGLEWGVAGDPPRVTGGPFDAGRTPIEENGFVLSYGGRSPPPAIRALRRGSRVTLVPRYVPESGDPSSWAAADHIVGGAGLLVRNGRPVDDWTPEQLTPGFAEHRHPRTMVGVAADGFVWLVTVDGRQPQLSAGMTLPELRSLAVRLALTDALNLDGGGSTTMWAGGAVVNSPSDAAGPRKVSDALLVFPVPH
jgi:exopolysaccharide biosynthesis protein